MIFVRYIRLMSRGKEMEEIRETKEKYKNELS